MISDSCRDDGERSDKATALDGVVALSHLGYYGAATGYVAVAIYMGAASDPSFLSYGSWFSLVWIISFLR